MVSTTRYYAMTGIWAVFLHDSATGTVISEMYDGRIWQGAATGAPGALPIRI